MFVVSLIIYGTFFFTLFLNNHLFHEKLCIELNVLNDIHFLETQIISKRFEVNLLNEYVACHSFELWLWSRGKLKTFKSVDSYIAESWYMYLKSLFIELSSCYLNTAAICKIAFNWKFCEKNQVVSFGIHVVVILLHIFYAYDIVTCMTWWHVCQMYDTAVKSNGCIKKY